MAIGLAMFGTFSTDDKKSAPVEPQRREYAPPPDTSPSPSYTPPVDPTPSYAPEPSPAMTEQSAADLKREYIHQLVKLGLIATDQEATIVYRPNLVLDFAPAATPENEAALT
jgi:hypothetical protein